MHADYLANNQSSLLVQMTNYFPTTYFGAVALVENAKWKGPLYVIIFAVISFVFFVLFYYIAERIFKRGYWTFNEYSKETSYFGGRFTKSTVQSSHLKAYVKKEFKTLFRTPQFS